MSDQLLGVTTCPTCQKRFRVSKKLESFVGKEIKCPKCNRPFVVEIQTPALIEQAAMASAAAQSPNAQSVAGSPDGVATAAKPERRTKAQIRKAAHKRIKKEFGPYMKQLEAISNCETSEERIRVWCIGVLKAALGYKDEDLDFEVTAGKGKIDIAVKHDGKVLLIIECKRPGTLPATARKAAVGYAASMSAAWAAVTNGQTWELHRVLPVHGQNTDSMELFNISLLDDDGLSTYDVERMYLLTKAALLRGETEKEFHRAQCLEKNRLFEAMISDRAITSIRRSLVHSYKKEFKEPIKLTDADVEEALKELIRPEDLGE